MAVDTGPIDLGPVGWLYRAFDVLKPAGRPSKSWAEEYGAIWNDPEALTAEAAKARSTAPYASGQAQRRLESRAEALERRAARLTPPAPPAPSGQPLPSYPATVDPSPYALRDRVLRAIERQIFGAVPKPRPAPKPKRNPRRRKPPPKRPPRRPLPPPRLPPDVPIRIPGRPRLPVPLEIFRKTLEATKRGMDEALKRARERGPKLKRPKPPDEPPNPPGTSAEPIPDLKRNPNPDIYDYEVRVPERRQREIVQIERQNIPEIRVSGARRPIFQPSPVPAVSSPAPLPVPQAFPALALAAPLALALQPSSRPRPRPAVRPAEQPGMGLAEALQPVRQPVQATEKCWTQCRQPGPKKKRKRKVCLSPEEAKKIGRSDLKLTRQLRKKLGLTSS